jgi:hypothetical protein
VVTKRGVAIAGARVAGGLVLVGGIAAVIAAAILVPIPSVVASAATVSVAPAPAQQYRVCPGPILQYSQASGQPSEVTSAVGSASVTSAVREAEGLGGTGIVSTSPLAAPDNSSAPGGNAPQLLTAPDARPAALLAASQASAAGAPDLRGFAATACGEAAADSWLVAGATTVGRTSLMLLANPTAVAANVKLTIYAENGLIDAPGAAAIIVAPLSQKVVSLAGFAPNVSSPVVHVESTGGAVLASMQQGIIRGLETGGVELVGASQAPSPSAVMTGVTISGTSAIAERLPTDGNGDMQAALRVYVPGSLDASLTVTATAEQAGAESVSFTITAAAGRVSESPLRDLPDGTYTLTVAASVPVVAAARTSVIEAGALDFAWYQSAPAQSNDFLAPIAVGPTPRLHLNNPGASPVTVVLTPTTGAKLTVQVPARGSVGVVVAGGTTYAAAATGALVASVSYSGGGQLSAYSLSVPNPLEAPIVIYP